MDVVLDVAAEIGARLDADLRPDAAHGCDEPRSAAGVRRVRTVAPRWTSWLLERATGDGTVLILPTASAPEGDEVFDRWAPMGIDHYAGSRACAPRCCPSRRATTPMPERSPSGSTTRVDGVLLRREPRVPRRDARRHAVLGGGARGASPGAWRTRGAARGSRASASVAPDSAAIDPDGADFWQVGLGLFPKVYFGPHWDALDGYVPGLRDDHRVACPDAAGCSRSTRTAVVGDGARGA